MRSLLSAALLLMLLNACTSLSFCPCLPGSRPQAEEREMFMDALEQFSATGNVDLLKQFQQNHPDTECADYAAEISRLAEKSHLPAENLQLKLQLDKLQQENAQLREKIDLVKKLLFDLERQQQ